MQNIVDWAVLFFTNDHTSNVDKEQKMNKEGKAKEYKCFSVGVSSLNSCIFFTFIKKDS